MVVTPGPPAKFEDWESEREYVGCLCLCKRLAGFVTARRTELRTKTGWRSPWTVQEVIQWRSLTNPQEPWDEWETSPALLADVHRQGTIRLTGIEYQLTWLDEYSAVWVRLLFYG
jgi:hypothetical protein